MENQEDMDTYNSIQSKQPKNVFKEHKTLKSKKRSSLSIYFKLKKIDQTQEKIFISKTYQTKPTTQVTPKKTSKTN